MSSSCSSALATALIFYQQLIVIFFNSNCESALQTKSRQLIHVSQLMLSPAKKLFATKKNKKFFFSIKISIQSNDLSRFSNHSLACRKNKKQNFYDLVYGNVDQIYKFVYQKLVFLKQTFAC